MVSPVSHSIRMRPRCTWVHNSPGVLVPGPGRTARPRVAGFALTPGQLDAGAAGRDLSAELGDRRRAFVLSQPALAELVGVSVTTVGHAETADCGSPAGSGRPLTLPSWPAANCLSCTTLAGERSRRLLP